MQHLLDKTKKNIWEGQSWYYYSYYTPVHIEWDWESHRILENKLDEVIKVAISGNNWK